MDHEFSWRKVLEAAVIFAIIYTVSRPITGASMDIQSILLTTGMFTLVFALASHGLSKLSDRG